MNRGMRLVYVLVGCALLLVLLGLIGKTRSINLSQEGVIVNLLRELQQVDANWNVEVLRAKTGMSAHYDEVSANLTLMENLQADLHAQLNSYWGSNPAVLITIMDRVKTFESLMEKKISLIEQFKSQNAILRNSNQFLHTVSTTLSNQAQKSSAPEARKMAFERAVNRIYVSIMTYLQSTDPQRQRPILEDLTTLESYAEPLGTQLLDETRSLAAHVKTILNQQDNGVAVLNQISEIDTAQAIIEISQAHTNANNDRVKSIQFLQKALVFFSAGLILLLIFMGYKLMLHYKEIQSTNAKLEDALSKLKESQVHQVQSEKMSALGQMVAGIAHEINTPLAYLKATFNVIQEQLPPLELVVEDCRALAVALRSKTGLDDLQPQIAEVDKGCQGVMQGGLFTELGTLTQDGIHGVDQISEIVTNLKNFSRLDREKVTGFSVENGLDSTLLLARNLIKYTVTVVKDYGHVPSVLGAPSQINQVFLNLITNAAHAMPQRPVSENIIQLRTRWLRDDNMVLIEVEDNGNGIAPENLNKIFDPFFTTKPIGQGTGMGLSISYKIIQEHEGRLEVKSIQGRGTTFSIFLPIERHNPMDCPDAPQTNSSHQALVD